MKICILLLFLPSLLFGQLHPTHNENYEDTLYSKLGLIDLGVSSFEEHYRISYNGCTVVDIWRDDSVYKGNVVNYAYQYYKIASNSEKYKTETYIKFDSLLSEDIITQILENKDSLVENSHKPYFVGGKDYLFQFEGFYSSNEKGNELEYISLRENPTLNVLLRSLILTKDKFPPGVYYNVLSSASSDRYYNFRVDFPFYHLKNNTPAEINGINAEKIKLYNLQKGQDNNRFYDYINENARWVWNNYNLSPQPIPF